MLQHGLELSGKMVQKKIKIDDFFLAISEPLKSIFTSTAETIKHPETNVKRQRSSETNRI